jgi:hypothetical protein
LKKDRLELRVGWQVHVIVFMTAIAIVVLRRPDAIFNPQFWAEDGAIWYANAYNLGEIRSLSIPVTGYFQTISRLVADFAQIFPFPWAPLIFNLVAIIIQVLPVNLMVSSRFSVLMPDVRSRLFLSFLYLALPNSWEIHENLTNAQWHLALLAFMVIVAAPSGRSLWRCFDIGVVLMSGLSGPFSLLLTPIAAFRWWLCRNKWVFILFLLTGTCSLIQATAIFLVGHASRSQMALGATPELLVRILSGQVFLSALIGQKGYEWIVSHSGLHNMFSLIIAATGLVVIVNALRKAPMELRLFIGFAALIFGATLISPQASVTTSQWQTLSAPGNGGRYWFMPMVAFVSTLGWMLSRSSSRKSRIFAVLMLAIMAVGINLDWRHPDYTDFKFREHTHRVEMAPKGTIITIPINPPGWSMTLIKH